MRDEKFQELDKIADSLFDKFEALYDGGEFGAIEKSLSKFMAKANERYSLNVTMELSIYDSERVKSVTVLETGISCNAGGKAFRSNAGETFQRYIADGRIVELPHSYCPHCWGRWDFKISNPNCNECGVSLGDEVRILLDTNDCPSCERGEVSTENPACTKCDFVASPDIVSWG